MPSNSDAPAPVVVAGLNAKPISDALQAQLDAAMGRVPAGKRGRVEAGASLSGVQASVGWQLSERWDTSAYYSRLWDGHQEAGVRVRYTW
jgi:hypothetical protein